MAVVGVRANKSFLRKVIFDKSCFTASLSIRIDVEGVENKKMTLCQAIFLFLLFLFLASNLLLTLQIKIPRKHYIHTMVFQILFIIQMHLVFGCLRQQLCTDKKKREKDIFFHVYGFRCWEMVRGSKIINFI